MQNFVKKLTGTIGALPTREKQSEDRRMPLELQHSEVGLAALDAQVARGNAVLR